MVHRGNNLSVFCVDYDNCWRKTRREELCHDVKQKIWLHALSRLGLWVLFSEGDILSRCQIDTEPFVCTKQPESAECGVYIWD